MIRIMGWRGPPDCQHLDNYRDCRVLHGQNWLQRLFGVRPHCILDRRDPPRDGEWSCDQQERFERPSPPAPKGTKRTTSI